MARKKRTRKEKKKMEGSRFLELHRESCFLNIIKNGCDLTDDRHNKGHNIARAIIASPLVD
jgi:hypothetical protein